MKINRRGFLKTSTAAAAGLSGLGAGLLPGKTLAAPKNEFKRTTSICPYCAVGCGLIAYTDPTTGKIVNIEGDPDHPINQGALCAKGAGLIQLVNNPNRVTTVKYRAPYSDKWEDKPWDWAMDRIAAKVKQDRDADFITRDDRGRTVNRTESIAHIGSAALDNEECWLLQGLMRSLGLVYIEHQARI